MNGHEYLDVDHDRKQPACACWCDYVPDPEDAEDAAFFQRPLKTKMVVMHDQCPIPEHRDPAYWLPARVTEGLDTKDS